MRADQGLYLRVVLVTKSNSVVILGPYSVNSSFHSFFLNLCLLWVYLLYLSV